MRGVSADTRNLTGIAAFLLGASGMFASMYSTQAILPRARPRLRRVGPARAGLTVSVVVLAIAVGVWFWGPLSDRLGRRRTMITASALLVVPTVAAGLAPTFEALLVCARAAGALHAGSAHRRPAVRDGGVRRLARRRRDGRLRLVARRRRARGPRRRRARRGRRRLALGRRRPGRAARRPARC